MDGRTDKRVEWFGWTGFCLPLVTIETLKASKNASRYMSAFKIVGCQELVYGPSAKQ